MRLQARDAYIPANIDITIWQPEVHALNEDLLSTPVQGSAVPDNPVFFLNEADIVQHMGQTTNTNRRTNLIDANGTMGDISHYWLRSVGRTTSNVTFVNPWGDWWGGTNANHTGTGLAFRPTIWVRR